MPVQPPAFANTEIMKILTARKKNYEEAVNVDKKHNQGNASKLRRLDRGLKEIVNLIRLANSGKTVSKELVPPPVLAGLNCSRVTTSSSNR